MDINSKSLENISQEIFGRLDIIASKLNVAVPQLFEWTCQKIFIEAVIGTSALILGVIALIIGIIMTVKYSEGSDKATTAESVGVGIAIISGFFTFVSLIVFLIDGYAIKLFLQEPYAVKEIVNLISNIR